MVNKPDASDIARLDADEYARLEADALAREKERVALEHDAQSDRDEQARREALEKAWREQHEYVQAVAELKEPSAGRKAARMAAIVLAVAVLGAVLYGVQREQDRKNEAEAFRIAAELQMRREEDERARLAAEAASQAAQAKLEAKPAPVVPEPAPDPTAKARALALKHKDEERRKAELAAKMQAEERARTVSAANVKEVPRAAPRPGTVFQDCADCPRMVVVGAGEFTMGSPASEAGRGVDEGPQRQVSIAQAFALGRSEVTVADFRRFADESGYRTEAERDARAQGCSGFIYADPAARSPDPQPVTSWRSPGLAQVESHPVICVSWNDARAYAQWLSKKTGKRYRLPTEAEWEYAARAGSTAARYWGEDPGQACRYANVADQSRFLTWGFGQKHECTDGHYFTAPAGGYAPNRFGLYDMIGNVWEWTEDCWNASYAGAPQDGAAWLAGDCAQRVLRGGSWSTVPRFARSAARHKNAADYRDNLTGFRLARNLD